jgi:hypothetical protein
MNLRKINTDGVVTYSEMIWGDILMTRETYFNLSDLWMLADRYAQLTEEQQTELTIYRQALRDITDYATANLAGDNFPDAPSWMN